MKDVPATADPLEEAAAFLQDGEDRAAWTALLRALGANPTTATCQAVADLASRIDAKRADLATLRVALLANFTADLLAPILVARALPSRLLVQPFVAEFDTWAQELLDVGGALDDFDPQVLVLALRLEFLRPELVSGFLSLSADRVNELVDQTAGRIEEALRAFRSRSRAKVLVQTFPLPVERALGVIDARHPTGQTAAIRALNARIEKSATSLGDVFLVDSDRLVALVGSAQWNDERMRAVAKLPLAPAALHATAEEYLRYLRAFSGLVRKVLVLDLDNTLWGGIVGEDGPEGIQLGETYPGSAYVELQRAILELHRRGVVLAINSHNNPEDVAEVLGKHPAMILQPEHFAATRINWLDKASNMLELAEDLSLGVESFVFLDDSDVQCERMHQALPEVLTVQQRGEVAKRAGALLALGVFDSLSYAAEDVARGGFYRSEAQRAQAKRETTSLDDFLRSLEMELTVERIDARNVGRAADLTQRTNQFNLTTRRYTVDELLAFVGRPGHEGYGFRLRDRFGDSGMIAVALLARDRDAVGIDTFLMSCRVLKRTVEDAILAVLADRAHALGGTTLRGYYRPTKKNGQVANFYPAQGFQECGRADGSATVTFERATPELVVAPEWIRIVANA